MAWSTNQLTVENIEVHASDINLNTDMVESDIRLLHPASARTMFAFWGDNPPDFNEVRMYPSTHALVGILSAHSHIHMAESFTVYASDGTVSMGESLSLAFKTSDSAKRLHIVFEAIADQSVNVDIIEDAVWVFSDASGSNRVFNRKRAGNNPSSILNNQTTGDSSFEASDKVAIFLADVAAALHPSGGVCLDRFHLGTGNRLGGEERGIVEWNLNSDTQYALRINSEANNTDCIVKISYYEHTDRD